MKHDESPYHKTPDQQRSARTVDEILQSASSLSDEGLAELLSARAVSAKSGYSVGTIYRYFEKIDDVFLELLLRRRKKALKFIAQLVDSHNPKEPLIKLITTLTHMMIDEWSSKNPKIIQLVIRQYFKRSKAPEMYNAILDDLIPSFMAAQVRDQSGTFKVMSIEEMRLTVRVLQMAIRNPFFEGGNFAGTPEHRRFVIDMGVKLLGRSKA